MNWKDRLIRAEKAGGFTFKDRKMAGSWLTCAVGERAEVLNLTEEEPSRAIENLGLNFLRAVNTNQLYNARRCFNLIQRWGARRLKREARA